jgi:hypothetical protein
MADGLVTVAGVLPPLDVPDVVEIETCCCGGNNAAVAADEVLEQGCRDHIA